jgi:hypothetical protein
MTDRYQNLQNAMEEIAQRKNKHLRYLEVGTYDGHRARKLLADWLERGPDYFANYAGFDLWEDMTPERNKEELSKSRLPPSMEQVRKLLSALGPRIGVYLNRGDTRKTLCGTLLAHYTPPFDLIFMDGGHSLDTVASDWSHLAHAVKPGTIVLLDDYYVNRDDVGCKPLVSALVKDPKYRVQLLDPVDHYEHTKLDIRMVRVQLS